MLRLEPWDNAEATRWDEIVASFDEGSAYHSWAWMEAVARLKNARMMPLGIWHESELVGVLPTFLIRRGPLRQISCCPGGTGYGGPLVREAYQQPFAEQVDALWRTLRADFVEFHSQQPLPQLALAAQRYEVQEFQTIVLSLAPGPEAIWARIDGDCRTGVRKARKSGITVSEATDDSFLDAYYEMSKETWSKSNRPPVYSRRDLGVVWDTLRPHNRIHAFAAWLEGRMIAAAFVLCFNQRLYGLDRAGLREHYRLKPNNLIDWTMIEWAASQGIRSLDMMGANIPGIAQYKSAYGGELRTYIAVRKDLTLAGQVGRWLYLWLVPRWRRLNCSLQRAGRRQLPKGEQHEQSPLQTV